MFLTLLTLFAATPTPEAPTEVHFRALAFDAPRLQLAVLVNKKPTNFEVYGQAFTPETTVALKEGILELYKPATPDPTGKPTFVPYAQIPIPANAGKFLLIISGNQTEGKLSLINDNDTNGAGGTMRFFNLSGHAVHLTFPGFEQTLNANDNVTFHPSVKNSDYGQAQVLTSVDGSWKPAKNLRWLQLEDTRVIYFILSDPTDPQRVQLRGIEERILPVTTPTTPETNKPDPKKSGPKTTNGKAKS